MADLAIFPTGIRTTPYLTAATPDESDMIRQVCNGQPFTVLMVFWREQQEQMPEAKWRLEAAARGEDREVHLAWLQNWYATGNNKDSMEN